MHITHQIVVASVFSRAPVACVVRMEMSKAMRETTLAEMKVVAREGVRGVIAIAIAKIK